MKRGLLIGVGTLGGLGAVLAITPPQFGSSAGAGGIPASSGSSSTNTQTEAAAPVQTQASTTTNTPAPVATKTTASKKKKTTSTTKSTTASSANTTATQSNTTQSTPTPAATKAATTSSGVSGTFAGATSQTRYGPVQVQITVVNGKITAAKALQYPNGDFRSADISTQAIPYLVQQTLAAQSANISGVGGASYTSYGWYTSLQSALAKAGMK